MINMADTLGAALVMGLLLGVFMGPMGFFIGVGWVVLGSTLFNLLCKLDKEEME
jgi:hypothetical protein